MENKLLYRDSQVWTKTSPSENLKTFYSGLYNTVFRRVKLHIAHDLKMDFGDVEIKEETYEDENVIQVTLEVYEKNRKSEKEV